MASRYFVKNGSLIKPALAGLGAIAFLVKQVQVDQPEIDQALVIAAEFARRIHGAVDGSALFARSLTVCNGI